MRAQLAELEQRLRVVRLTHCCILHLIIDPAISFYTPFQRITHPPTHLRHVHSPPFSKSGIIQYMRIDWPSPLAQVEERETRAGEMEERYKAVDEKEEVLETRIANQQSIEDEFYRVSQEWAHG